MDESELRITNQRLMSSFPALRAWFDDNRETFGLWCGDIREMEKSDVLEAVDQIRRGEVDRPRGHQDLLQAVIRTSRQIAYQRNPVKTNSQYRSIDGHETFSCRECRDSGLIDVVRPFDWKSVSNDRYGSESVRMPTCVVSCDCQAGEKWRSGHKPLLRYDPSRMCRIDRAAPADEQWRHWEAWHEDFRPQNYNHEFEDWGATA